MAVGICTIVGVGPGLGRAVAERFAYAGYAVGLIARDARKLEELAASMRARGYRPAVASADAADPASLRKAIATVESELGGATTVLVYNAVAFTPGTPTQLSPESLDSDFRVSVTGALVAAQAVASEMKQVGAGTILLTGGGLALHPNAHAASLSLGKTGIRCLAFLLAQELRPAGIRVATITVAGYIQPGTHFDPLRIAEVYYQTACDGKSDIEIVYK